NRKEYDELFVGFVLINQYIFYAGVFFLIGIPSFMRMPAAHIKNGKIRWENTMGKYDGKIRYSPRHRTICQLKELVSTMNIFFN
ncbi:TPA: hypothetical protein ACJKGT_001796, partial [Neisseria meningitidis]